MQSCCCTAVLPRSRDFSALVNCTLELQETLSRSLYCNEKITKAEDEWCAAQADDGGSEFMSCAWPVEVGEARSWLFLQLPGGVESCQWWEVRLPVSRDKTNRMALFWDFKVELVCYIKNKKLMCCFYKKNQINALNLLFSSQMWYRYLCNMQKREHFATLCKIYKYKNLRPKSLRVFFPLGWENCKLRVCFHSKGSCFKNVVPRNGLCPGFKFCWDKIFLS